MFSRSEIQKQLYLSGRWGGPFLTVPAQSVRNGDEFSGDGGDDDLLGFSYLAEAISEGTQARVVICCDQCRLEHHVPRGTKTACDGPFSATDSAVVRDWGHSSECRSVFAGDGADLEHRDGAHFLMLADLGQQPFAHLDQ
jgi:hypothetical protein